MSVSRLLQLQSKFAQIREIGDPQLDVYVFCFIFVTRNLHLTLHGLSIFLPRFTPFILSGFTLSGCMFQVNGVECLSDILNADRYNEMVRSEAAGVVAQITSPTLDHYQHINGFIENMEDLIRSLTSMYFFLSLSQCHFHGCKNATGTFFRVILSPIKSEWLTNVSLIFQVFTEFLSS